MQLLYSVAFVSSAVICALIAAAVWKRRSAPGALGLWLLCVAEVWWSTAYALQWILTDHQPSMLWLVLRIIGVQTMPSAVFILVLGYTGRVRLMSPRFLAALAVQPLAMLAIVVTDPWHHLYLAGRAPALRLLAGGIALQLNYAYSYGLILAAAGLLLVHLAKRRPYRLQTVVLFVGVMLPVVHYALEAMGFALLPQVNAVPFTYTLTDILLWFALTRLGFFRVLPVARDQLVEQMAEGIIVFDASRRIADINPAAVRMLQPSGPCIGLTADEAFPRQAATIAAIRAGLEVSGARPRVLGEFGTGGVMEASASVIERRDGERIATLVMLNDVTEQTRAAKELGARSEQLAAALERSSRILTAMTDGVLLVDAECVVLSSNPAADTILGVPDGGLEGRPADDHIPSLPARALAAEAAEAGVPVIASAVLADKRSLTVEVIPLLEAKADGARTLFIFRDETERHAAERMQRDFVANVAHELQTPLTGLSLLADTIPRALRDDPDSASAFVQRLGVEIQRLIHMTTELMTLSRVDQRASADSVAMTDLSQFIADEVAGVDPLACAKEQTLSLDAAGDIAVPVDEGDLGVIVGNLLDNAVRYTDRHGHIDVVARLEEGPDGRSWAVISVSDDGGGIPRDDQDRIFERFYRVDKARSRRTGGAGLGLSIVREAAERYGGSVAVQSEPGKGSAFTVRLPAARSEQPQP